MRRREFGFLALGLLIGLLVGIVLIGSSDDLGKGLFGTAGLTPAAVPNYFLVDMTEAQNWLTGTYPDESDALTAAFNQISQLATTDNFAQTVQDAQPNIDFVVDRSYIALTGELPNTSLSAIAVPNAAPSILPSALLGSLTDSDISTCLGLDENPYNPDGYALYFYLEIPSTQAQFLPETWIPLDEPKDDSLFWQRLACQQLTGATGERTR